MTPFRGSTPPLCARIDDFVLMHCAQLDNRFDISYRSEEGTYSLGSGRRVCQAGSLTLEISISHHGWRYPETVRMAVRRGAPSRSSLTSTYPAGTCPQHSQIPQTHFHEKADDALPIGSAGAAKHASVDLLVPQRQRISLHPCCPMCAFPTDHRRHLIESPLAALG